MILWMAAAAAPLPAEVALLPLPPELRGSASILAFDNERAPRVIRAGTGAMACRMTVHNEATFDARCYHRDFVPAVFRAWILWRSGVEGAAARVRLDSDFKEGRVPLLRTPSAGYRMLGPVAELDPSGERHGPGMARWQSIHFPYRTAAELGLSEERRGLMPYVMASGSWWSHVMINDDGTAD